MAVEQIQWSQLAEFEQQVLLNGTTFRLNFKYNEISGRYIMDIYSADRTLIVSGTPLVRGILLTSQVVDSRLPNGDFVVFGEEPNFENLGSSSNLYFVTD